MAVVATGEMALTPDLKGFESKLSSSLGGIAKKAALAFGGLFAAKQGVDFFTSAVDGASDLEESMSKVGVVFGPASKEIEKFAATSAKSLGQSKQQALEAAGTFGNLAVSFGLPQKTAADMSKSLVTLGADLASFNNTSVDEALTALRSGLTGEMEPLKRFGIALDDASLRQKALELGLVETTKTVLPPAIKAQAAYALILDRSKTAQGDFARTSGGLANKQRILAATITDLKTRIGNGLLPVISGVASFLIDKGVPAFEKTAKALAPFFKTLSLGVGALGAAFKEGDVTSDGFVGKMERFGNLLRDVYQNVVKPFVAFIADNWQPAFEVAAGVVDDLADAFLDAAEFVSRNSDKFKAVAGVIAVVLIPHYVAAAAAATVSAATQVASWVTVHLQAVASLLIHSASIASMIAGWVAAAVAATANALVIAAAWIIALGPAGLLIAAIAAVGVALVVAYNKSETFRNVAGPAVRYVKDQVKALVDNVETLISVLKKAIELAGKLNKLPGVGIAKKGLGALIPGVGLIPGFAEGGVVPGRLGAPMLAMVHGGERITPPGRGGVVFGPGSVVVTFAGNVSEAQAYTAGQAVGRGAAYEMERAEARRAARVA